MHDPSISHQFPSSGNHHRRAHSVGLPDNLDLVSSDQYDAPFGSFNNMGLGSKDDLFSTYMNMDKFSCDDGLQIENGDEEGRCLRRHRHSKSVECIEAKKAMTPDELAQLWTVDPKRAKRIIANRQSAARSKERKARYISQLERKVQTLQTEATTLSAQLTLLQRDTAGLTAENSELKIRLQTLEQQAHLRDALNESLKKEVERVKKATGETSSSFSDNYSSGLHNVLYKHSFSPNDPQSSSLEAHHRAHATAESHGFSVVAQPQQDSLSRLHGLDIIGRDPVIVKIEGHSLSASECSS